LGLFAVFMIPKVESLANMEPINKLTRIRFRKGITKYNTPLNKLIEFKKRFKTKIKHADLDLIFYAKFVNFLSQEQKINLGTIAWYQQFQQASK